MAHGATRTITYNGDNMPAQITVDANTVDFVYDGSGVRAKKTVDQTNAAKTIRCQNPGISYSKPCRKGVGGNPPLFEHHCAMYRY